MIKLKDKIDVFLDKIDIGNIEGQEIIKQNFRY